MITWLLADHLGSTSVTADGTGNLLTSLKYTAFGEIRTGNSFSDYQYTGQRNELEIGLYYYIARFYDPQLARFISADTIVPEPGSVKAYDRFSYVNNNPINLNDPSGHCYNMVNGQLTDRCKQYWKDYNSAVQKKYGVASSVSQKKTSSLLINVCGWGTGMSCESTTYDGKRPLSTITKIYQNWSDNGEVIWNGFIEKGNPTKTDEGRLIYQQIINQVNENNNTQIYLIAHSAGTDATIYSLSLLQQYHPEMMNNIVKVAILDVDLTGDEINNKMGSSVNEDYAGKIYYADSGDYETPGFIDKKQSHPFNYLNHKELAIDNYVAIEIQKFFGW